MFDIILQIGAGTGLLFLLRWFWWRINAYSEITAMVVSFLVAAGFQCTAPGAFPSWVPMVSGVAITTAAWVLVTCVTPPTDEAVLRRFCNHLRPGGPGWARIMQPAAQEGDCDKHLPRAWNVPAEILCAAIGCLVVYSALFGTGYWIYGHYRWAAALTALSLAAATALMALWRRVHTAADLAKGA